MRFFCLQVIENHIKNRYVVGSGVLGGSCSSRGQGARRGAVGEGWGSRSSGGRGGIL